MTALAAAGAGALLFVLLFLCFFSLLRLWTDSRHYAGRLVYRRRHRLYLYVANSVRRFERPYRHLSELLESMRVPMRPEGLVLLSGLLMLAGMTVGALLFQSVKGCLLLGAVLALLPYTLLRTLLVHRQMQTRLDFLPAVELFYQCYLVTGERHIRTALQRAVEEQRMPAQIQVVFEQLYRNLSVRGDDEASLRIFAASLGHVWADYFVNILSAALTEGHPVTDNVKELITDMRKARRANEQERTRLLEIRLANFTPILFLALFMGINFHYNPDNSYLYYVLDPQGRDMLLNAAVLIFASFLMGLWLSRKKM